MPVSFSRAWVLVLWLPSAGFALQTVAPVEGTNSFAKISARETTRIAIESGRIRRFIANEGELVVEKDEERGQIFIRPANLEKPVNIRILSSSGKWFSLVLQPVDMPQEDVVLIDPDAATGGPNAQPDQRASGFEQGVRALINVMADAGRTPARMQMVPVNQEVALWQGTRFVLRARYRDRNWVGERYELTNLGAAQIRVVEQELFRRGVVAVAVENLALDPGQSTFVYVIHEAAVP
jgi:conjugal transfer pilus assembly protein TraK